MKFKKAVPSALGLILCVGSTDSVKVAIAFKFTTK